MKFKTENFQQKANGNVQQKPIENQNQQSDMELRVYVLKKMMFRKMYFSTALFFALCTVE